MRYYPYDFMASILYNKIFCNVVDETSDWGMLDARDIPEWALLRQKECELMGKACMGANVEKVLAHSGNRILLVEAPTGRNHFYDLWVKWGCPKMYLFKVAFRSLWVKHDCPNKPEWDKIVEAEANVNGDILTT